MILSNAYEDGWMQTYSGRQFWPTKPRIQDINIVDIAYVLGKQCRYAGHCVDFYSVAEHCVLAARVAPEEHKLTALMHDASEAYLVDIPKPLKPFLKGYYEFENTIMEMIAEKYGFEWPLPQAVKDIDMALLRDERDQNMVGMDVPPQLWGDVMEGTGQRLMYWSPQEAADEFLKSFKRYTK